MTTENVKADINVVTDMTNYVLKSFLQYLIEHPETRFVDAFMCIHSCHKAVIRDIALNWELRNNIPAEKTLRMADLTFRQAMKDLAKELPSRSPVSSSKESKAEANKTD